VTVERNNPSDPKDRGLKEKKEDLPMKQQIMNLPEGRTIADLARAIETVMMTREGLTTQLLTTANGDYVIQGRSANANATQWVGMDKNLTIKLMPVGERCVMIQAGSERWLSKSALLFTGTFIVAWPLAVTSGIGLVKQKKLADRMLNLAILCAAGADQAQVMAMAV
jgi:hypothetical protein